jgi:pyridoxamine 5'-phosphate oxidase
MTGIGAAPLELLRAWLPPNETEERPQIQLATVDERGRPDVRTVLLSEWDEDGFVFHTDAESRKAAQLAHDPAVAIAVLWPGFSRQLVITGTAEAADRERLDRGFAGRSPYLKQLAWQNSTALAQEDRADRIRIWNRFADEHDVSALQPPTTWAGYLVRPDRLTFWQSDPDGPSHRLEFRLEDDSTWSVHHLAG